MSRRSGLYRRGCGGVFNFRYRDEAGYKIRNPRYSQMIGRHELFERERHSELVAGWHGCDLACGELDYAKL